MRVPLSGLSGLRGFRFRVLLDESFEPGQVPKEELSKETRIKPNGFGPSLSSTKIRLKLTFLSGLLPVVTSFLHMPTPKPRT